MLKTYHRLLIVDLIIIIIHEHPLEFIGYKRNGWNCDGRNANDKCQTGITDSDQTSNTFAFRCDDCDYFLCEQCIIHYLDRTNDFNNPEFIEATNDLIIKN